MAFFESEVAKKSPVLLACLGSGASRDGLLDVLREVASFFGNQVRVLVLDEDSIPAFARKYDVVGTPTFLVFSGGEMRDCFLGKAEGHELVEFVRAVLAGQSDRFALRSAQREWLHG